MIITYSELVYLITIFLGMIISFKKLRFTETQFSKSKIERSKPFASIIVPARNEEMNISNCLDSLISLEYPNYEIIVVDGGSTDNTIDIASSYKNVKIIKEPPLPNSWVGKPWGCHIGAQEAKGEILLFTDADTIHSKESLDKSVSKLEESNGFVTLVTTQIFVTFWEHLLVTVPILIISITVNGVKGTSKAQIANGQYMMFTRSAYDKIGGHESVHDSIIEDLALGTIANNFGYKPSIIINHNLVKVRMYQNLEDIFGGFTKNLGLGMKQVGLVGIFFAAIINIWAMGFLPPLITAIITNDNRRPSNFVIPLFGYLSFALFLYVGEKKASEKGTPYVLLYPVYFLMFWIIVLNSLIKTFFLKNIKWKDRIYAIPK